MKVSDEIIAKLSKLKIDNSISSYPHIKNIIKNQRIPVVFNEIRPFKIIRYRSHNETNKNEFFKSSEELSYRTDILNINKIFQNRHQTFTFEPNFMVKQINL